jgi:hypothetical protein
VIPSALRLLVLPIVLALFEKPLLAQCSPNGWCKGGETESAVFYVKALGRQGSNAPANIKIYHKSSKKIETAAMLYDCSGWRVTARNIASIPWEPIFPGTAGEENLKQACGF